MSNPPDDIMKRIDALEASLEGLGQQLQLALEYRSRDPHGALNKCRAVLESVLRDVHRRELGEPAVRAGLLDLLRTDVIHRTIPRRVVARMHSVRDLGNVGSHLGEVNDADATMALDCINEIIGWYLERYGFPAQPPVDPGEGQPVRELGPSASGTATTRRHRHTRVLLALGLLVLGIVLALGVWRITSTSTESSSRSSTTAEHSAGTDDSGACPGARNLAGLWRFKTVVLSAKSDKAIGTQGFYRMMVAVDGCEVRATVSKTGYTRKAFKAAREQTGSGLLEQTRLAEGLVGASASFVLRNNSRFPLDTHFDFVFQGDALFGYWRHENDEWARARLRGVLVGHRGDGEVAGTTSADGQPCVTRCRLACPPEVESAAEPLASCLARCAREPWRDINNCVH